MYYHENTMKVAQTRLHVRQERPNVENCRDPAQYKYVKKIFHIRRCNNILVIKE